MSNWSRRACTRSLFGPQGFSIIYIPLILLLLIAFVAMAVDTGRIRLAKAQLQGAADAAARAGAINLPNTGLISIDACAVRAQNVAQANDIAETKVQVTPATDIHWGTWNSSTKSFTELFGAARYSANACKVVDVASAARGTSVPLWIVPHVTTFDRNGGSSAKLSTVSNLQAEAIAWVTGFVDEFDFVGITGINSNGNKAHIAGNVATDGNIDLGNGDIVASGNANGDARPGMNGGRIISGPNGKVAGWSAPLDYLLSAAYPPVTAVPGGAIPIPSNKKVFGGSTPATAQKYSGDGSGVTITSGYVIIYQTANLNMGATFQNPSGNTPSQAARLTYYMVGNHTINPGNGNSQVYAHVYAPQSDYAMKGTQDFYGWLIAKSITFKGNSSLNYDGSKPITGKYKVQLVK